MDQLEGGRNRISASNGSNLHPSTHTEPGEWASYIASLSARYFRAIALRVGRVIAAASAYRLNQDYIQIAWSSSFYEELAAHCIVAWSIVPFAPFEGQLNYISIYIVLR